MTEESQSILINNLKGRVSKLLGSKITLPLEEISSLEEIYYAIDDLILSSKKVEDFNRFKKEIMLYSKVLKSSRKYYVKEHILPIINKISTKKWEGNE